MKIHNLSVLTGYSNHDIKKIKIFSTKLFTNVNFCVKITYVNKINN